MCVCFIKISVGPPIIIDLSPLYVVVVVAAVVAFVMVLRGSKQTSRTAAAAAAAAAVVDVCILDISLRSIQLAPILSLSVSGRLRTRVSFSSTK